MREHLKSYNDEILTFVNVKENDIIVDIGSNDSTMLQYYGYPDTCKYRRIGIDPTGNQFKEYYGSIELLPTYFTYDNFVNEYGNIKCKIVSSICMFYDLPDPVQFAKDIYNILDDDGIWTCEQSYLLTMLQTNSIDTICHEHLEYYALHQVKKIADMVGFKIINVSFNSSNGGSFRVYFNKHGLEHESVKKIINNEIAYGIMNKELYTNFMIGCNREIHYLKEFIKTVNNSNKKIYIYGASTKGNCLLQYADIGEKDIQYAVERNLNKIGKMTSTGIKIISEETMRENPPDYLLVLPWHFKNEIIEREKEYLKKGKIIFPFPNFEIISSKPKVLITGCDGMIAHYVKERFTDYNLYGISRNYANNDNSNIVKFSFDMNDRDKLEEVISIVKPDSIIHLASISSSQYAFQNPIETLHCNGMLTAYLCEIIHKKGWKTKLFNASSSEIYKGHIDYEVKEDDHNMYHCHPYSIAKIMGHSMVDFYRNTYGLPFSNGVLFTTESPLKKPTFLLNKVAQHIKEWQNGNQYVLYVGNLDSYRNIIQAADVANAIHIILSQDKGDNYNICGDESKLVYDIVVELYENAGITIVKKDNVLYDGEKEVVIIQEKYLGFDSVPTNIRGNASKLKLLNFNTN
jgi:GDP-mannose 4,6-dehydratase